MANSSPSFKFAGSPAGVAQVQGGEGGRGHLYVSWLLVLDMRLWLRTHAALYMVTCSDKDCLRISGTNGLAVAQLATPTTG
jgi:hypothetical protein